ncbi:MULTISPECIES: SDR family oxidoreductase [Streptomyces]|uniref:SDR family oxidoreductase n=1 Tax=Streptomyces TaxID=1883 RepID=UPI001906B8EB|nr:MULTISPECIES: SDR family oxidoreductase [unclassified Streptomyces]MCU4745162.1 SDR family oxidoreductase [Streptomyces sp. G-5]QQN81126.1 SDR family oxidoreductase [Streptomyces sp. XC 2026]
METRTAPLAGKIALVAGATRGAGRAMAVELGRAGATVYATGRTTRAAVSEVGRATETIEETAELITAAGADSGSGGTGIAVPTDHLVPEQVAALTARIDREQGRLDVLVNDIWGGDHLLDLSFAAPMWELDLEQGLRMMRLGAETHIITSHYALPLLVRNPGGLLVEVTDGTAESNREYRQSFFFDLTKKAPLRMAYTLGEELKKHGCAAVCVTPGFLRSEAMLDTYFKVTEENWREGVKRDPAFAIAESPTYIGRGVAALAADPDRARWNGASLSSGDLGKEYGVTDTDGSQPDAWPFIKALAEGKNPDAADYR